MVVGQHPDFLIVCPIRQRVGPIADGVFAEGRHVLERHIGQWVKRDMSQPVGEIRQRFSQLNGESCVVNDFQSGERATAVRGVPFDRFEIITQGLFVGDRIIPGFHKIMGLHLGAVGESGFPQRHRVGAVTVEVNGFGRVIMGFAVGVVIYQAGEQGGDDFRAAGFIGVGRQERVLRLRTPHGDELAGNLVSAVSAHRRVTAGEHEGGNGDGGKGGRHDPDLMMYRHDALTSSNITRYST